jgi:hypothetical protein
VGAEKMMITQMQVVNNDGHADRQAISPNQTRLERTGASENDRQQTALKAA